MQAVTEDRGATVRIDWGEGQGPAWLRALRRQGAERFETRGYPNVRDEDWKYTDIAPIAQGNFRAGSADIGATVGAAEERCVELGLRAPRLVFINGRFAAEVSDTTELSGVQVRAFADGGWELAEGRLGQATFLSGNPFVALNTGFLTDGAVVHVTRAPAVSAPINLVFLGADPDGAAYPRVLILLEPGSEATVVETYASLDQGQRFTNPVTEVELADGAILAHGRVLIEGERALHVGVVQARLGRASVLRSLHVAAASEVTRTDLNVEFTSEGAECSLNGLYIASAGKHVDNHTLIDHAAPQCTSRQLYKGVIGDQARGVFNGKVIVRPGAQKTDANQTNRNLLLSRRATVDTKPQLEIFADDVRCTHGATVGPPDAETLFYLQSRGLSPEEAIRLVAYGFGADVLTQWPGGRDLEPLVVDRIEAAVRSGGWGAGAANAAGVLGAGAHNSGTRP